jgi:hypothetical protein
MKKLGTTYLKDLIYLVSGDTLILFSENSGINSKEKKKDWKAKKQQPTLL